jgi:3-oxoacyl-[acyl-carrier-protein] synthase-3
VTHLPRSVVVAATGSYLPERVVTNEELEQRLDTTAAWIVERTGIRERHVAAPDETTSDLGAAACRQALERAGVSAEDVDLVVCATSSPDWLQPATASAIHGKLGLRPATGSFDLNAVCSGFPHAYHAAASMLAAEPWWRYALVVGAECYSRIVNPDDRTTGIFFGDGAGAVVLQALPGEASHRGIVATHSGTDFSRHEALIVPAGAAKEPLSDEALEAGRNWFFMDGPAVKSYALEQLPKAVRQVCADADVDVSELKLIVPHQSNLRILEQAAAELNVPMDVLHVVVDRTGNCAGASIPIALDDAVQSGKVAAGDLVCLAGYGGGLTWAATLMRW